jgi:hypothetical protein
MLYKVRIQGPNSLTRYVVPDEGMTEDRRRLGVEGKVDRRGRFHHGLKGGCGVGGGGVGRNLG